MLLPTYNNVLRLIIIAPFDAGKLRIWIANCFVWFFCTAKDYKFVSIGELGKRKYILFIKQICKQAEDPS